MPRRDRRTRRRGDDVDVVARGGLRRTARARTCVSTATQTRRVASLDVRRSARSATLPAGETGPAARDGCSPGRCAVAAPHRASDPPGCRPVICEDRARGAPAGVDPAPGRDRSPLRDVVPPAAPGTYAADARVRPRASRRRGAADRGHHGPRRRRGAARRARRRYRRGCRARLARAVRRSRRASGRRARRVVPRHRRTPARPAGLRRQRAARRRRGRARRAGPAVPRAARGVGGGAGDGAGRGGGPVRSS